MKRLCLALLFSLLLVQQADATASVELKRHVVHADGRCEFTVGMVFPNGVESEIGLVFASCDDARSFVSQLEATEENLVRFLLAYWLARDPDWSNPNLMIGKTLSIDFAAANPIKVQ